MLGTAQTLAWASTYYLPAMLAAPMAETLALGLPTVLLAFSMAMLVSALIGPFAGSLIDQYGGRPVLMGTSVIFAAGLAALAVAQGPLGLFLAWAIIGIGMGGGLYEAAFATLVRLYRSDARSTITGITLVAGFASTIGWPLSAWMEAQWGWRGACLGWAALHLVGGLPLHAWLPRAAPASATSGHARHAGHTMPETSGNAASAGAQTSGRVVNASAPAGNSGAPPVPKFSAHTGGETPPATPRHPGLTSWLLAFVFAATWFVSTAMATHLPALVQAGGASLATAVAIGALIGPAQVAGRLLEFGLLRRVHPLLSARLASLAHPLGAGVLLLAGTPFAAAFAILHGAGNGILTIAKGTLPLVLFGPHGYGARQGWLMIPARFAQAVAPFAFGLAVVRWGSGALWLSTAIGVAAFAALLAIRVRNA